MKRTPTYRLAPEWRPRTAENTETDEQGFSPFLERVFQRREEVLAIFGPKRHGRGPDGRFLEDPWPGLAAILLLLGSYEPPDPESPATFKELMKDMMVPEPTLHEYLNFWVQHGLLVKDTTQSAADSNIGKKQTHGRRRPKKRRRGKHTFKR